MKIYYNIFKVKDDLGGNCTVNYGESEGIYDILPTNLAAHANTRTY